ncbi:MAG: hypothetical protein E7Z87_03965 [Cyanobacteria bacterium SIG26]|nr:hypothetical protein [Cyanobacteria bacterium SIG26]
MLRKILNSIANPILYYVDKSGNSVFRNYCFLRNNGCFYNKSIPKKDVGRTLEYRFEMDKFIKRSYIWATVIIYLVFIHFQITILNFIIAELIWLFIVCGVRVICSKKYNNYLESRFGKYDLIKFRPPISKEKFRNYRKIYIGRAVVIICLVGLLFLPALFLQQSIKVNVYKKHNYSSALKVLKFYSWFYPLNVDNYDYSAVAKYMSKDLKGALSDYEKSVKLSGENFDVKKDIIRLGNILYLKKQLSNPNEAIDLFNELATNKKTNIDEESQLVWIKSMFKIENNITDGIIYDYDNLLASLDQNDINKWFYITSDKAYVSYLAGDYVGAIDLYDSLIEYAENNNKFAKELVSLYAERAFAKRQIEDFPGAEDDFKLSQISPWELTKYEPRFEKQTFVIPD